MVFSADSSNHSYGRIKLVPIEKKGPTVLFMVVVDKLEVHVDEDGVQHHGQFTLQDVRVRCKSGE